MPNQCLQEYMQTDTCMPGKFSVYDTPYMGRDLILAPANSPRTFVQNRKMLLPVSSSVPMHKTYWVEDEVLMLCIFLGCLTALTFLLITLLIIHPFLLTLNQTFSLYKSPFKIEPFPHPLWRRNATKAVHFFLDPGKWSKLAHEAKMPTACPHSRPLFLANGLPTFLFLHPF